MFYIGTSGWHYNDWIGTFYPKEVTGYNELRYISTVFNTVENNSSFYRIAKEGTYKTWNRMTPEDYTFSLKLNKIITHNYRLKVTSEVQEKVSFILDSTQVLKNKLGAIVIQLPASFKYDLETLNIFLSYFSHEVRQREFQFDIAIEFRNSYWFTSETYKILEKYNVALVYGQSSRYPGTKVITANFTYIRMHGPGALFASKYSSFQLEELAIYLKGLPLQVKNAYVYFNNDYYGYAIENAKELQKLCS